ncbi:hypothetical protein [Clostridium neonatale]|uniref:hypothetical protein n=1 Tax=Clostridium neonatale TaxID=137838 RepID=UPI00291BA39D|nr:conserved hypothetical protein [Clostridium neonatale]
MSLEEALKIVRENDYIAIKPTKMQLKDMQICDDCEGNCECMECSCSICLAQE